MTAIVYDPAIDWDALDVRKVPWLTEAERAQALAAGAGDFYLDEDDKTFADVMARARDYSETMALADPSAITPRWADEDLTGAYHVEDAPAAKPPALAAPYPQRDAQDLIDAEIDRDASAEQQAAMERLIAPILTALAEGLTPEEIMGRMDDWYGQLDDSLLQELLTRGMAAADAIGRIEAAGEGAA